MFCIKCGTKAFPDAKFCANCGAALVAKQVPTEPISSPTEPEEQTSSTITTTPLPEIPDASATDAAEHTNSPELDTNKGPTGVGGWLLLLVVGMMILGPLMLAAGIGSNFQWLSESYPSFIFSEQGTAYKTAAWWAFLIISAISFFGGWGLGWDHSRSAVFRAKAILWINGPGALVVFTLINNHYLGTGTSIGGFVGALIGSAIIPSLWTAYLLKSKRVQNTYGDLTQKDSKSSPSEKMEQHPPPNEDDIFQAAEYGNIDLIEAILKSGIDVNIKRVDGTTPLYLAALNGKKDTVITLIKHGADQSISNSKGKTPLDAARMAGHEEIANYLDSLSQTQAPERDSLSQESTEHQKPINKPYSNFGVGAAQLTPESNKNLKPIQNHGKNYRVEIALTVAGFLFICLGLVSYKSSRNNEFIPVPSTWEGIDTDNENGLLR